MSKTFTDSEKLKQFEERKKSHLKLSLNDQNEAQGLSGLDNIQLHHEALPDINFENVSIASEAFTKPTKTPFLISSMTAGHEEGAALNLMFAQEAAERGWLFAVGSQRRELSDPSLVKEWINIRKKVPSFIAIGNIGLSQLVHTPIDKIRELADGLQASAMIVHLNALQEALQLEGTPQFKGGLKAIKELTLKLGLPVIIKETGCGFSLSTLRRLNELKLSAIDVGGFGGTHWGRIEGERAKSSFDRQALIKAKAAESFSHWGISTLQSVLDAVELKPDFEVWGSGGVRSGLDAAKLLALGAQKIGFAKPLLLAALQGRDQLSLVMETLEFELKTALFCTGHENLKTFQEQKIWTLKD